MLGFLKLGAKIVSGVSNFIKKKKAVKSARLEKKAEKIANQKMQLLSIGAASSSLPSFELKSLKKGFGEFSNFQGIKKASGMAQSVKSKDTGNGNTDGAENETAAMTMGNNKSIPIWLWPVAALVVLFVMFKKK